ncbi:electron transport complex subunit D [Bisbaumannia pacifica]|uniref:Ion-translocating oxidoreductase complex subunit D n=2 Tax=Bisbaumannia pacifica TaxID=77098 RepID=A0A510XDS5_9GAMM|nr:RnfABCDGE type electron transport complex subunit D [Halomonas pacifica]GEK48685.1 electron transport complex subunit D [Halomonas pacifica]
MSLMHASTAQAVPGTPGVMRWVLVATLPGIALMSWHFGWGVLANVLVAGGLAMALEALMLRLRGRAIGATLGDHSALVSGVLLGAALPPFAPWWLLLVGVAAAIVVAKHLYGGLGQNLFNPAMVGYALLLIAFPVPMTQWVAPLGLVGPEALSPLEALRQLAGLGPGLDALSGATPLDAFKHKPEGLMAQEFWAGEPLPPGAQAAWRDVALGWLAGGALLLWRRLIDWRIPLALLGSLTLLSGLLYAGDPSQHGSPAFHLFAGAAIFGACFIATDPVSAAAGRRGRWLYGAAIGVLVVVIRTQGAYPDAIAFAVLLMNFAVPLIDHLLPPRPLGRRQRETSP